MSIARGVTMSAIRLLRNCRTSDGREPNRFGVKLKSLVSATCAAFLFLAGSGLSGPAMSAGDPVAGQASYLVNCTTCHGASPSPLVLTGANAPDVIATHVLDLWEGHGLRVPVNSADIAAYLESALNYEGLWWNSPGGSQPGWGINIAQQGDT